MCGTCMWDVCACMCTGVPFYIHVQMPEFDIGVQLIGPYSLETESLTESDAHSFG